MRRTAGLIACVSVAVCCGPTAVPASAAASQSDTASTTAYLRAQYTYLRAVQAHLPAARKAVGTFVHRVGSECPGVFDGAPQGEQLRKLRGEVSLSVLLVSARPDRRAFLGFAHTAKRLHWRDHAIARRIHANLTANEKEFRISVPPICADARSWVASKYEKLSASTTAFIDAMSGAVTIETEPTLEQLLARHEGPRARRLAVRIESLGLNVGLAALHLAAGAAKELDHSLGLPTSTSSTGTASRRRVA